MNSVMIAPEEWRSFFDHVSRMTLGKQVELGMASEELGDQVAIQWSPIQSITYDEDEDVLAINTFPVSHSIEHPKEVIAAEDGPFVRALRIKDADQCIHLMIFKWPLMLVSSTWSEERTRPST